MDKPSVHIFSLGNITPSAEMAVKPNPDPEPGWDIPVKVINELIETNPAAANAVINEVAKLHQLSRVDVIKRLP